MPVGYCALREVACRKVAAARTAADLASRSVGVRKVADEISVQPPWIVTASVVFTLAAVYAARMAVIVFKVKSYRLGGTQAPPPGR